MKSGTFGRLSLMMFMQYALWGAWLPLAGRYLSAGVDEGGLGFTNAQIGFILGVAGSVGAILAPFIAGQLADRYFSAERFLAFLLVVGGIVKWITASQTGYTPWLWLSIVYGVVYMPTLALTNSIAFAHLENSESQFPYVRVWGTIGWIASSWLFSMLWLQHDLKFQWMPPFFAGPEVAGVTAKLADSLRLSGIMSVVYAVGCLFLPHTPPKSDAVEPLAFKKALGLFREPSFTVLIIASLAIAAIHQIYFIQTGPFLSAIGLKDSQIAPAMTIGQFAEIGAMAALGLMLKRLGFRWVIFIGALAYFGRYAIFGTVGLPMSVIVASMFLHGFCYACFFAAGFIYVDKIADSDIRHSVQTVFGIIILGGGPVLGGYMNKWLGDAFNISTDPESYAGFWYTSAGIGLIAAILISAVFREKTVSKTAG